MADIDALAGDMYARIAERTGTTRAYVKQRCFVHMYSNNGNGAPSGFSEFEEWMVKKLNDEQVRGKE